MALVTRNGSTPISTNRNGVDAQMDERTLREIYLPGFKAAVVTAGVWTLMGAYNKFRGQH